MAARRVSPLPALVLACALACAFGAAACVTKTDAESASGGVSTCTDGSFAGASYDIGKSKFAFGGAPVRTESGGMVRWVGPDGVVAIFPNGSVLGTLNGGAPEASLPDYSADPVVLRAHVLEYFAGHGLVGCQVSDSQILGGSGGSSVSLQRAYDGIPIVESVAYARFDRDDQTTSEGLYWPAIPASTLADAKSFRDQLRDPTALAAYRAKLPAEARGAGYVVIHHNGATSTSAFRTWVSWNVFVPNPMGKGGNRDYDRDGVFIPYAP